MTPERYYAVVAERALTSGRPLDVALEEAARIAGPMPSLVRLAIERLRTGRLHDALVVLEQAGLDPLLCQAAEIRPQAMHAVRERLDALPGRAQLAHHFRHDLSYFIVVFIAQAGIASILSLKVLPVLTTVQSGGLHSLRSLPASAHLQPANFQLVGAAGTLAAILAFVATVLMTPLGNVVAWRVLKSLRAAAVYAAAAGLAAAGLAGDAQRFLALHPKIASISSGGLDAISLDEISSQLVRRAQLAAGRSLLYTKIGGTALALGIALAIIVPVYAALPYLWQGITSP